MSLREIAAGYKRRHLENNKKDINNPEHTLDFNTHTGEANGGIYVNIGKVVANDRLVSEE